MSIRSLTILSNMFKFKDYISSVWLGGQIRLVLHKNANPIRQPSTYHVDDMVTDDNGKCVKIVIVYEGNCFIFETDCYDTKFDIDKFIEKCLNQLIIWI
jgi:hypothetical protein